MGRKHLMVTNCLMVTNFKFLERGVNSKIVLGNMEQCPLRWWVQYKSGSQVPFYRIISTHILYSIPFNFFLQMNSCNILALLHPFEQKQPPDVFYENFFAIFTGEHLCWSLFLIKMQAYKPATLLKRYFNTCVFLWILQNI